MSIEKTVVFHVEYHEEKLTGKKSENEFSSSGAFAVCLGTVRSMREF